MVLGIVIDVEIGELLIGVNILVVGSFIGIVIDFDGSYLFNLLVDVK